MVKNPKTIGLINSYGKVVQVPIQAYNGWNEAVQAAELLRQGGKRVYKNGKPHHVEAR